VITDQGISRQDKDSLSKCNVEVITV